MASCVGGANPDTPGERLAIEVAPLDLPGVTGVCYDLQVINGASEPPEFVWTAGQVGVPRDSGGGGDTDTLCSMQYGAGGGLTYVGTCDASVPTTTVRLFIDSLWDGETPIADYVDPCPVAEGGCALTATCLENQDVPVTFNLTVMRRAQQGFFDIGVNFKDIFCSAKLDCTYDEAGTEPIELLFDPETGTRGQTAVLALACTAGPDEATALHTTDVVVTCGDTSSSPWSGNGVLDIASFCIEPTEGTSEVYGGSLWWDFEFDGSLTTTAAGIEGGAWVASGDGAFSFVGSSSASSTLPEANAAGAARNIVIADRLLGLSPANKLSMIARLGNLGSSFVPSSNDGMSTLFSGVSDLGFSVLERESGVWTAVQDLAPFGTSVLEPRHVDPLTRAIVAEGMNEGGPNQGDSADQNGAAQPLVSNSAAYVQPTQYVYARDPNVTNALRYLPPRALVSPNAGETCSFGGPIHGLMAGACGSETNGWRSVLVDLDALSDLAPSAAVPFIEPFVAPEGFTITPSNAAYGARPLILDADHVVFQMEVCATGPAYLCSMHLYVATRGASGWSGAKAFPGDGTTFSTGSWTNSACSDGGDRCQDRNGTNGVMWGTVLTMAIEAAEGVQPEAYRFVAYIKDGQFTPRVESAPLDDYNQDHLPVYAWRGDASTLLILRSNATLPDKSVKELVAMNLATGATVDGSGTVPLYGDGSVQAVQALGSGGYRLFTGSYWRGEVRAEAAVDVVPSGGSWAVGDRYHYAEKGDALVNPDPWISPEQSMAVLNPAPCEDILVQRTDVDTRYNPSPETGNDLSATTETTIFELTSVADPSREPLAHSANAITYAYPLKREINKEMWSNGICYEEAAGAQHILGGHMNWDIAATREGIDVNLYSAGSGLWSKNEAGPWTYSHLAPAPTSPSMLPALPAGQVYTLEIDRLIGSKTVEGTARYYAIGRVSIEEPSLKMTGGKRDGFISQRFGLFEQADGASAWSLVQLVEFGTEDAVGIDYSFDRENLALFFDVSFQGRRDSERFVLEADTAATNGLRYGAPRKVLLPAGYENCWRAGDGVDVGWFSLDCNPIGGGNSDVFVIGVPELEVAGEVTPTLVPKPCLDPEAATCDPMQWCSRVGLLGGGPESGPASFHLNCGRENDRGNYRVARSEDGSWVTERMWSNDGIEHWPQWVRNGIAYAVPGDAAYLAATSPSGALLEWTQSRATRCVDGACSRLEQVVTAWQETNGSLMFLGTYVYYAEGTPWGQTRELTLVRLVAESNEPEILAATAVPNPLGWWIDVQGLRKVPGGLLAFTNSGLEWSQDSLGYLIEIDAPTSLGGAWSLSFVELTRNQDIGTSRYWSINGADPSWTLDLRDDVLNPRPCDALLGYSSDNNGAQWEVSVDLSALSATTEVTTLDAEVALPTDPLAPAGQTTYDFVPETATASVTSLDPTHGTGNAWPGGSGDPSPLDPIWQYATFAGQESLLCGGAPCNKRYWNVAIGFDPGAADCRVDYVATAAPAGEFVDGSWQTNGSWPVIHYSAVLTGPGGATPDDLSNLVCRQNPLDGTSNGVYTSYASPGSIEFCHSYDGTSMVNTSGAADGCAPPSY
jgi:hypothetical protein